MKLLEIPVKIKSIIRPVRAGRRSGLMAADEFHDVLQRERLRADRSGLPLSLIAMRFAPGLERSGSLAAVSQVILQRVRATDEAGWLRDGRVGVAAPYTPAADAQLLVDDLVALLPLQASPPQTEIMEYRPGLPPTCRDGEEQSERVGTGTTVSNHRALDDLWLQATPVWKRLLDVVGSAVGLVLCAPLLAVVAVAIKWTAPGPVFFTQDRAGLGGRPFRIYKFRTMVVGAEKMRDELLPMNEQDGPAFKIGHDPRITAVGHWLRRLSIDELPQLWNVLRGDMSLVGPRPLPCAESDACDSWQRGRLTVPPGMTCIWQVQGRSEPIPFAEWMRMDIHYTRTRSLLKDCQLLLRTVGFVLGLRGR